MAASIERLQPPYDGMNVDASPEYVPTTQAPLLENLLPSRKGVVPMRGPFSPVTNPNARGLLTDQAVAVWTGPNDTVLVTSVADAQVVKLSAIDPAVTVTPSSKPLVATSVKPARVGNMVFGIDTALKLTRWNPGDNSFQQQTSAPEKTCIALVGYLQRLFVLGGTRPGTGGAVDSPQSIFWTNPLDPLNPDATTLSSWQDATSGLVNQIVLPDDDIYTAIVPCGRSLVVLGARSVVRIAGDSPSAFDVRTVSRDWGLLAPPATQVPSVVQSNEGIYYLGSHGLVYYDGVTFRSLSDDTMRAKLASVSSGSILPLSGGYLLVILPTEMYLVDTVSASWVKVSSSLLTGTHIQPVVTDHWSCLWTGTSLISAGSIAAPEAFYATGNQGDSLDGTTHKAIKPALSSRWFRLGYPLNQSQLNSLLLDYSFTIAPSSAQQPSGGFRVSLQDSVGNVLLSPTDMPSLVTSTPRRQRFMDETFAETDTVQLVIDWPYDDSVNPPPVLLRAELYDGFLAYAATRPAGSY